MEIVQASLSELDLLVPLFDAYRVFSNQGSNEYKVKEFLKERLEKNDSRIFLATENKKPIGFLQIFPSFSSISMNHLWILNDLYVDKNSRKKSVATKLIEEAKKLAEESESGGLMWETTVTNTNAEKLYEKLGFSKSDRYFVYNFVIKNDTNDA